VRREDATVLCSLILEHNVLVHRQVVDIAFIRGS
jgi:hypothetical protein